MSFKYVLYHHGMLRDAVRMAAYQTAVREIVRSGDVVVDIGTGSGILAFLAVQAGARRVYAIERGPIIRAAKRLADANGFREKVTFIHGEASATKLPERADVILSEILGNFGIDEDVLAVLTRARREWAKPGGVVIPSWLTIHLMPVECRKAWQEVIGFWEEGLDGIRFSELAREARQTPHTLDCTASRPLAEPALVARYDLSRDDVTAGVLEYRAEFTATGRGALHGLVGFFGAGLSPGVEISTSPDSPLTHWKQVFFPGEESILIEPGDLLRCRLTRGQDGTPFWFWELVVARDGKEIGKVARFSSSVDASPRALRKADPSSVPCLSPLGLAKRRALALSDGVMSLGQIAAGVHQEFPEVFTDVDDARLRVASWLWKVLADRE